MKVLITGAAGFAGSHLAAYAAGRKGVRLFGLDRRRPAGRGSWERFEACDLMKAAQVRRLLKKIRPDRIFHLAGQTSVPLSWKDPQGTFAQNVFATQNLLEAVRGQGDDTLIHIAGSSEEYGRCLSREMPITEKVPLRPATPYAVSKVAQDFLAYQYHLAYGARIIRTRAFNHTGPGQNESFVASDFARQVSLIEAGRQKPVILVGNTRVERDFTDVRDIVRGYWAALEKCQPGEVYNLCSGAGRKIGEVLGFFLSRSRVAIRVRRDPERLREGDITRFVGDPRKFAKRTGWRPEIPFEKTLDDLLDDWRGRVGGTGAKDKKDGRHGRIRGES